MSQKSVWLALIVAAAIVVTGLFWLDMPAATFFAGFRRPLEPLGAHLGSVVLVGGEAVVGLSLALYRILAGRLADWARVTVIACAASLSVFALNEVAIKALFGMPNPAESLAGASHAFRFFQGNWQSSFPSGHMVLASGFTGTFIRQDRRLFAFLATVTALAGVLLVAGDWHFLSDVAAGIILGGAAGVTAATLWKEHQRRD